MRLTHIAQVPFPAGRVLSLVFRATPIEAHPLPVSFDQRRHVGEGVRPGSWVAVSTRLDLAAKAGVAARPSVSPVLLDRVADAWRAVVARHGTLRTVFSRASSGEVELHEAELGGALWHEHPTDGSTVADVVRNVLDRTCTPFEQPSYRLLVVLPDDGHRRPVVIVGSDHAHVDLWSLAILVNDFTKALDDLAHDRPAGGSLAPAAAFTEHSALLAAAPPAPAGVERRWQEILAAEGGAMPRFPLPLGDIAEPRDEVVELRGVLDRRGMLAFEERARAEGVRPIALAIAQLAGVTRERSGRPLRAVFPVHSRTEQRWRDSVGWYVTDTVLECADPDPAAAAASVSEAIALGAYPLAPIAARVGGMPHPSGMFALSWLDSRRTPVGIDPALELQYISAAMRTDGVMLWFMVGDDGMQVRCRYPGTPEAARGVGGWLDAVVDALRDVADAVRVAA